MTTYLFGYRPLHGSLSLLKNLNFQMSLTNNNPIYIPDDIWKQILDMANVNTQLQELQAQRQMDRKIVLSLMHKLDREWKPFGHCAVFGTNCQYAYRFDIEKDVYGDGNWQLKELCATKAKRKRKRN